ncbi:MAG: septum formation initiator family protein [Gordonia sp. (in: high G+C Gram-positive bacteria)]|uniref:FtsB family cell division protein n=1 Tax=Gordonia sp. (in: high G+C Gram-positive bacteria) TaxID=84139 RepID=UPI003BB6B95C
MAASESGRGKRGGATRPALRRPRAGAAAVLDEAVVDEAVVDEAAPKLNLIQRLGAVNAKRAAISMLVFVMLALTLAVPMRTYLTQRAEFDRLEADNASLTQDVGNYQRRVTELNDPAYVERQARERLQYVMPGEKPVVLTYPAREQQASDQQKAREYAANPWYSNLWDALSTPPEGK